MPDFARPANQLQQGGDPAIAFPGVSLDPTARQGFSLNAKGEIPTAVNVGQWTWEYVTVNYNIGDIAAHTGGDASITIPGLQLGDLCFCVGATDATNLGSFFVRTSPPTCNTVETINLRVFNADTVSRNPDAANFHFLVVHRFITQ